MRKSAKILAFVISVIMMLSAFSVSFGAYAAEDPARDVVGQYDYKIKSTYKNVDWDNWKAYKAATHVHTVRSDADIEIDDMIEKYYELGYDALALTDHGTVNYGWTKNQSRLTIFTYQYFVHGPTDELSKERYEEITTGTGIPKGGTKPRGYGMTEIPLGIELNGMSTNKCHINGFFVDAGHGDLGTNESWPRSAVKKNYDKGGVTHINHVGEWADAKHDIGIYNEKFVSDFASIYQDYCPNYEGYSGPIKGCLGMELVNTADSRTRNDRYLYDEVMKILAPQGINMFVFCEDDAHDFGDCDRNAQYFIMPSNDKESKNIEKSMKNGEFYTSSKNSKNAYELGDGFVAEGNYPSITRVVTDDATSQIRVTVKDATKARMVADGALIETYDIDTKENTVVFDLNNYEEKIGSYVRIYFTGAGGITYLQTFLLTKEDSKIATVKFNTPSTDTTVKVYDNNGTYIAPSNAEGVYALDAGDYTYIASRPGYVTTDAIPFTVTQSDIDNGVKRVIDVTLEENQASVFTYFYVPETIYLNPTDSTTFKNYVDRENEVNGSLRSDIGTTGNIFFGRSDATDISITYDTVDGVELNTLSLTNTSSPAAELTSSVTSGSMKSALSSGGHSVIRWTARYKVDGKDFTSYAYSYVYAPLSGASSVAAAGGFAKTTKALGWLHDAMGITATLWLAGVHSVSGGTASYKYAPYGGEAVTVANEIAAISADGSGLGTASGDSSGGSVTVSPVGGDGYLTIDTSRYTNFSQIPNLSVGLDVNSAYQCKDNNDSCVQYLNFGDTRLYTESGKAATEYNGKRIYASDNSSITKKLDIPIDKSKKSIAITSHVTGTKSSRSDTIDGSVNLILSYVDKTALRKQYENSIKFAYQSDWFGDHTKYDEYVKSIKDAAIVLGDPTASATDIASAKNELDAALGKVELGKGTYTVNYCDESGNILKSENGDYTLCDTVTAAVKEFDGYTYSNNWTCLSDGSQISTGTETFSSIMATRSDYTWNFYYSPNKYTVTFATPDESYQPEGGSGTTAVYGEDFVLPTIKPVQDGYTFNGWFFDLDGATYNAGSKIKWAYAENGTFTAQWSANAYTATYDSNGGSKIEPATATAYYGDIFDITETIPTKLGYAFGGWLAQTEDGTKIGVVSAGGRFSWMYTSNITFNAQWTVVDYTVTLDPVGGSVSETTLTKSYGGKYGNLPTPVRSGYVFDGWYLDKDYTEPVNSETILTTAGDHTLYAKWSQGEYSITYIVDGAKYRTVTYGFGDEITPLAYPTKAGHTFSGWSELPSTMPDHDITVTGTFSVNTYTLTYTLDGEEYKKYEYKYNEIITAEPDPEKIGSTFSGWHGLPANMPAYDVTVTGYFAANTYKVTYYVDGTYYSESTYKYGDKVTAISEPTKSGYTFSGWSNIPSTMPAENISVYGTFAAQKYKITYYVDGTFYNEQEYEYGAAVTPLADAAKRGYTFSGWSTIPTKMPSRNITVNGVFTVNQYSFFFVLNGTLRSDLTIKANYGDKITAPVPEIGDNYEFSGWSPSVPSTMDDSSTIFYGTTSKARSTVEYDINGAVGTAPSKATYSIGKEITLPGNTGFTKSGYVFKGWADSSSASNGFTTLKVTENDITLYAVWKLETVIIKPADSSSTVVDNTNHFIYGVAEKMTKDVFEKEYIELIGDNADIEYQTGIGFGTGTIITAVDTSDGESVSTYTLVVYGDLDGDGIADGRDVLLAQMLANGMLDASSVGETVFEAADCDHDGKVTQNDVELIINSGVMTYTVTQTK